MVMMVSGKWFGEKISKVISRGDFLQNYCTGFKQVSDIVVSNVDVLDLPMVPGVLG